MSADHDREDDLLASISDGAPADWSAAEREAAAGGRANIVALHELARIADFHRGLQREPEPAAPRESWGDLLLLERLGAGARAEVFRAWDPELRREVALKLMRAGGDDAALIEEGRAAARIRHPHVVTVHGIDRRDDRIGLRMELVRGATLEQHVRAHGPLDLDAVRALGLELGGALAAVHGAGILHRDLKPANVVRRAEGGNVLADFSLGRSPESAEARLGASGTPMYMAPELLAGAPASVQTDLYALGMLLWFALTGKHPFEAKSLAELASSAGRGPKPSLRERRPEVPAALARIVERAIEPDPERRFASTQALADALAAWKPRASQRWLPIAAAIFSVLGVAGMMAWLMRPVKPEAYPPAVTPPVASAAADYAVEASFLRRGETDATRLAAGDRVKPGDRLSLEVRVTRPAWVYVLNEDERGERYLLYPQPSFDTQNPIAPDSTFVLPGTLAGKESAWKVTSAGGKEYFLVVASPEPVPEIEAELASLPAPEPGRAVDYARVGDVTVERLRGVGGVEAVPEAAPVPAARSQAFDRFRALAGRETGVRGVWVRQIVLENPGR